MRRFKGEHTMMKKILRLFESTMTKDNQKELIRKAFISEFGIEPEEVGTTYARAEVEVEEQYIDHIKQIYKMRGIPVRDVKGFTVLFEVMKIDCSPHDWVADDYKIAVYKCDGKYRYAVKITEVF